MSNKKSAETAPPDKPIVPKGPTEWLVESTRRLPAIKYAFGVVAVVAVAAISTGFFLTDWMMALYGGVAAFLGMILMRIYAVSKPKSVRIDVSLPVQVLMWTGVVAFMVVVVFGLISLGMRTFASENKTTGDDTREEQPAGVELKLIGEKANLFNLGSIVAHLQNYHSQTAQDAEDRLGELPDTEKGTVFLSKPLLEELVDPIAHITVRETTGKPPAIPGFIEIYLIPPDPGQDGFSTGKLYHKNGVVNHPFTGTIPAGSTVVVVYAFDQASNNPADQTIEVTLKTKS
ncbi:MAG TPA: hypothetical protein VLA12_06520 [Planctomycetaceae bacterium]|nr:hypothetical protein [Planctomycetaceae bacterium]